MHIFLRTRIVIVAIFLLLAVTIIVLTIQRSAFPVVLKYPAGIESASYSPDSRFLATVGGECTLSIWDTSAGKQVRNFTGCAARLFETLGHAKYSPDGKFIAVVDYIGDNVLIFDADSLQLVQKLVGPTTTVNDVSYSPDGHLIVTASDDHIARIWDVSSGSLLHELIGHRGRIFTAQYSPDKQWIVTASDDHTARIWDATTGIEKATLIGHSDLVWSASYSPDGQRIITASADLTARIWDTASYREEVRLDGGGGWVMGAVFNSSGYMLLTYTWPADRVRVWDSRGKLLTEFVEHEPQHGDLSFVLFSPDNLFIATGAGDTVKLWSIKGLTTGP